MEKEIESLKKKLQEQEKLASLGILSAGIAHEIQNPLNFVINFSKMSDKLLKDLIEIVEDNKSKLPEDDCEELSDIAADLQENMNKIVEHGERAINIIRGILLMSRGKDDMAIPTDIPSIVKEYVWLSYHAMRANNKGFNITIREDYQHLEPVTIVQQHLSRAVMNVMNNACYTVWKKAQTAGDDYKPEVDIKVSRQDQQIIITITDNGEGMNDEVKQRIYENFFTTKPAGHGTGLGMNITRELIEDKLGGKISFESTEGKGTCFTFSIPVSK